MIDKDDIIWYLPFIIGLFGFGFAIVIASSYPSHDMEGAITLIQDGSIKLDNSIFQPQCPNIDINTLHIGEVVEIKQPHAFWPFDHNCTILVKP